jgi:2-methylcitrate dehydratase PrpD
MTRTNQDIAHKLADFVAGLRYEDIPVEVRDRAKHLMLDAFGVGVAAAGSDFAESVLAAYRKLGAGGGASPVFGTGEGFSPRDAAAVNGGLIHALEWDDTHSAGVVHGSSFVLPCALAAALMAGRDGRELLVAYVAGIEVAARIGMVADGRLNRAGFHPTGVLGAFACSLVAGRLMGLDATQLATAQGIALSLACGSQQFMEDGAPIKKMHSGFAAAAGITAAALAESGVRGLRQPYEGRLAFYYSHIREEDRPFLKIDAATAALGEVWEVANVGIKPYAACHFVHACIDSALALAANPKLDPASVTEIRARIPAQVMPLVSEPWPEKLNPQDANAAQFSLPYVVAAAYLRRQFTLDELTPESLADPEILALAAKVRPEPYENADFPRYFSGEVEMVTRDGADFIHCEHQNRGCVDRPYSNDDIIAKFRGNMARVADAAQVDALQAFVLGIDAHADLSAIAARLAVPGAGADRRSA